MATATKTTKKTLTPQERGEKWLKDNNAQEGLFIVAKIFEPKEVETKNGKRMQYRWLGVPVAKGSKFDIKNADYMSVLVKPDNKARMAEFSSLRTGRYSFSYRTREVNGRTYYNVIKSFEKPYKSANN